MKIICNHENETFLKEKFKPFESLPITLVQSDVNYDSPAIYFNMNQCDKVIDLLKQLSLNEGLIGEKDGRYYPLNYQDILFFESFTKDTFAYTTDDFYRVFSKISDIEKTTDFTRISRTTLVNLTSIKFILPTFSSKLILHLKNDMEIEVNRAYIKTFKSKIGMKVKK